MTVSRERLVVLGDLIPSGLVVVEVVFSIELAARLYVTVEGKGRSYSRYEHCRLEERLTTGHGKVKGPYSSIWLVGILSTRIYRRSGLDLVQ